MNSSIRSRKSENLKLTGGRTEVHGEFLCEALCYLSVSVVNKK
jgi:hypothetical protein